MAPRSAKTQSGRSATNKHTNASNAGSASGQGGNKRRRTQTARSTVVATTGNSNAGDTSAAQLSVNVAAAPPAAGNVLTRVIELDRARRAAIAEALRQHVRADMIATLGRDGANELLSTAATSNEVAAANQESTSGDSNLVGDGGNDGTESVASGEGNEYASMGGVGVGIGASNDNNDVAGGNEGVGENDMEGQSLAGDDAGRVSVASVVTGPGNTTVMANVDPRLVAYFASLQQYGMVRGVDEDKQMVTLKIPELFRHIKFISDDSLMKVK